MRALCCVLLQNVTVFIFMALVTETSTITNNERFTINSFIVGFIVIYLSYMLG